VLTFEEEVCCMQFVG